MKKLHYGPELFRMDGMPNWVQAIAINDRSNICLFDGIPKDISVLQIDIQNKSYTEIPFEHDYEGDWKDSLLIKPEEVKIGDFVKGWNTNFEPGFMSSDCCYGFITDACNKCDGVVSYIIYQINNIHERLYVRKFNPEEEKEILKKMSNQNLKKASKFIKDTLSNLEREK